MLISLFGTGIGYASADTGFTTPTTGASVNNPIGPTPIQGPLEDIEAPVLLGFSFEPTSIDTSSGPATVTVTIKATDNMSGLCLSTCSDGGSMT